MLPKPIAQAYIICKGCQPSHARLRASSNYKLRRTALILAFNI